MDISVPADPGIWELQGDREMYMKIPLRFELQAGEGVWIEHVRLDKAIVPSSDIKQLDCKRDVSIFVVPKDGKLPSQEAESRPLPLRPDETGGNTLFFQAVVCDHHAEDFAETSGHLYFTIAFNGNTRIHVEVALATSSADNTLVVTHIKRLEYPIFSLLNAALLFVLAGSILAWNLYSSTRVFETKYYQPEAVTATLSAMLAFFGLSFSRISGFLSSLDKLKFFTFYPEMNIGGSTFALFSSAKFFLFLASLVSATFVTMTLFLMPIRLPQIPDNCKNCTYRFAGSQLLSGSHVFRVSADNGFVDIVCGSSKEASGVANRKTLASIETDKYWWQGAAPSWKDAVLNVVRVDDGMLLETVPFPLRSPSNIELDDSVQKILGDRLALELQQDISRELCGESQLASESSASEHTPFVLSRVFDEKKGQHVFTVRFSESLLAATLLDRFRKFANGAREDMKNVAGEKESAVRACRSDVVAKQAKRDINPFDRPLSSDSFVAVYSQLTTDISRPGSAGAKLSLAEVDILIDLFSISSIKDKGLNESHYSMIAKSYGSCGWAKDGIDKHDMSAVEYFWDTLLKIETALGNDSKGAIHTAIEKSVDDAVRVLAVRSRTRGRARDRVRARDIVFRYLAATLRQDPANLAAVDLRGAFFQKHWGLLQEDKNRFNQLVNRYDRASSHYAEFFEAQQNSMSNAVLPFEAEAGPESATAD